MTDSPKPKPRTVGSALAAIAQMPQKQRDGATAVIFALADGYEASRLDGFIILTPPELVLKP